MASTNVGNAYVTVSARFDKSWNGAVAAKASAVGNVIANGVSKAFGAITNSLDAAIGRVDTMNNFPRIMENMGIGTDAAKRSIDNLSRGIDGLPTALDTAVLGVERFTSKNSDVDKSTDYFLALNDAILAGGASSELQSSAIEQLSQAYAKGKMDMMEWRSLQQAMPAQLNQIAKAMGKTTDELGEGLRKGTISMDDFMDTVARLDKEGGEGFASFADQAKTATGGIGTALTNVQNRVNKAVAGIIDAIGAENISGAINAFSSKFGKIASIIGGQDAEGKAVGFIAGLKDGLTSAFDGWSPKFNIDWDSAFGGAIAAAQKAGEWLSGPISTAVQTVDDGLSRLGDAVSKSFGKLKLPEIDWKAVADGVSSVVSAVGNFTFDAIGNAIETLSTIGSKLQDVFGPFIENIAPGLQDFAQGAADFFSPIADFLTGHGPAFEGMMERIQGHLDDLQPILDSTAGLFNDLCEHMRPIAETLGPAVAEVLGTIASVIVGMFPIAVNSFNGVLYVLDGLAQGVGGLIELFKTICEFLDETFSPVVEGIGDVFEEGAEAVKKAWEPIKDFFVGIAKGVIEAFLPIAQAIGLPFADAMESALDSLEKIESESSDSADGVKKSFDPLSGDITKVFDMACTGAGSALSDITSKSKASADGSSSAFDGLPSHIDGRFEDAQARAAAQLSAISSKASSAGSSTGGAFDPVPGRIGARLEEACRDASGSLDGISSSASTSAASSVSAFDGLGGKITNAIGSISMPTPHVSWHDISFAGKSVSIPKVEWYATGGFVDGPSLIGAGEAGPEMILPQSGGLMDSFSDAVATRVDTQAIVDELQRFEQMIGPIIADYAPSMTRRDFGRNVRRAVAYG